MSILGSSFDAWKKDYAGFIRQYAEQDGSPLKSDFNCIQEIITRYIKNSGRKSEKITYLSFNGFSGTRELQTIQTWFTHNRKTFEDMPAQCELAAFLYTLLFYYPSFRDQVSAAVLAKLQLPDSLEAKMSELYQHIKKTADPGRILSFFSTPPEAAVRCLKLISNLRGMEEKKKETKTPLSEAKSKSPVEKSPFDEIKKQLDELVVSSGTNRQALLKFHDREFQKLSETELRTMSQHIFLSFSQAGDSLTQAINCYWLLQFCLQKDPSLYLHMFTDENFTQAAKIFSKYFLNPLLEDNQVPSKLVEVIRNWHLLPFDYLLQIFVQTLAKNEDIVALLKSILLNPQKINLPKTESEWILLTFETLFKTLLWTDEGACNLYESDNALRDDLLQWLKTHAENENVMVRQATFRLIGRIAVHLCSESPETKKERQEIQRGQIRVDFLKPLITILLKGLEDSNSMVKIKACEALHQVTFLMKNQRIQIEVIGVLYNNYKECSDSRTTVPKEDEFKLAVSIHDPGKEEDKINAIAFKCTLVKVLLELLGVGKDLIKAKEFIIEVLNYHFAQPRNCWGQFTDAEWGIILQTLDAKNMEIVLCKALTETSFPFEDSKNIQGALVNADTKLQLKAMTPEVIKTIEAQFEHHGCSLIPIVPISQRATLEDNLIVLLESCFKRRSGWAPVCSALEQIAPSLSYDKLHQILSICFPASPQKLIDSPIIFEFMARMVSNLNGKQSRDFLFKILEMAVMIITSKGNSDNRWQLVEKILMVFDRTSKLLLSGKFAKEAECVLNAVNMDRNTQQIVFSYL